VKFSHDRKVRSLAKKTLGSTRVGRAIRLPVVYGVSCLAAVSVCPSVVLPGAVWSSGWLDILTEIDGFERASELREGNEWVCE
jgi:hypothetical protein